jgi:primase-polymerase (primpol)-like protein
MLSPDFSAMPAELRRIPRWVVWKGTKVPYCPTAKNSKASVTEPDTWASFDQAQTAYEEGGYQGVGFVLSGDGIVGVDLGQVHPLRRT